MSKIIIFLLLTPYLGVIAYIAIIHNPEHIIISIIYNVQIISKQLATLRTMCILMLGSVTGRKCSSWWSQESASGAIPTFFF